MLKAADLMITNPQCIDADTDAAEALDLLTRVPSGVLVTEKDGIWQRPITFTSALREFQAVSGQAALKASDLADQRGLPVSPGTPADSFASELIARGALLVKEEGRFCGLVTAAELLARLVSAYSELDREMDAVINFSSDEVLVADGNGKVLRANALFEEYFGVSPAVVIGQTVQELEKKRVFFPSVTRKVMKSRSTETVIQTHRDGRTLLATGTPAFNPDGSIFRVIVNTRDITRLNKLKEKLEDAELLTDSYRQELNELRRSDHRGDELVYASPAMTDLVKTVQKIASVSSTVLLTGESGSGKGMIARYIHRASPRRDKTFTVVNCGAIPENLLESELFGYTGGAFTGARREGKIGKMELANEGTLFLDEITELPLNLQVKLLHVLQEGKISRVGGTREIQLDLRFIAATNRDIVKMVEAGQFREDLFFRLDVIPLEVPPLRKRKEDVEALASMFLKRYNQKYHQSKRFSAEVIKRLKSYHWPGNVRELENLVERMMIVVDEEIVTTEHLPRNFSEAGIADGKFKDLTRIPPLREARDALEKELLVAALNRCRTTYEIAAVLEIDQSSVVRKLKKYGLS